MCMYMVNGIINLDKKFCLFSVFLRIIEGSSRVCEFLKFGVLVFFEFIFYSFFISVY